MNLIQAVEEAHQPISRCPLGQLLAAFADAERADLLTVLADKIKYPATDVEVGLTKIGHRLPHIGAPAVRNHRNNRCSCVK